MIAVIVMVMTVMIVTVRRMPRYGVTCRIGATLRIEWRFDLDDARSEPAHHLLDHVVATNPQTLADNLGRQMAVTEMPGDPNQMRRISTTNFNQRLGRRDNLDHPPIIERQRIATPQRNRFLKIKQKRQTARTRHHHTAAVTVVEIEHDAIGSDTGPVPRRNNLRGARLACAHAVCLTGR
ncbi:hypothetical protein ASC80_16450 [Afipia sp. Root123D2]|nr:hypothetical protein ASC80_16450 [Afipia sp. Root123D2]